MEEKKGDARMVTEAKLQQVATKKEKNAMTGTEILPAMTEPAGAITQADLEAKIRDLAALRPELSNLTSEQIDILSRSVVFTQLQAELSRKVTAARINWEEEKTAFLSDCRSDRTRDVYRRGLKRLSSWMEHKGITPADLSPRLADDYIRYLRAGTGDADTHRVVVSACSAFFTFLERRFDEIRNPFRGTRARPRSTWPTATIPTKREIDIILEEASPVLKAAITVMVESGIRIGGLPSLEIKADKTFRCITKGRAFTGPDPLPIRAIEAIKAAGLSDRRPFGSLPSKAPDVWLKVNVLRLTQGLYKAGKIRSAYSCHDFRHFFAEKNLSKGVRWVQQRLGHSSLSITERYLQNVFGESEV